MYHDYSQAYMDIMDNDPNTNSYNQFLHLGNTITPENKAKRTVVKVGTEYQDIFVITDGLKPGDKVITSNIQKVRTGTAVTEVNDKNASEKTE